MPLEFQRYLSSFVRNTRVTTVKHYKGQNWCKLCTIRILSKFGDRIWSLHEGSTKKNCFRQKERVVEWDFKSSVEEKNDKSCYGVWFIR